MADKSQIRKLAFEALAEYPDGQIPASCQPRDLYPEIYQSPRARSADRKKAEDALKLLNEANRHRASLDGEMLSAAPAAIVDSLGKLEKSLIRVGLYDILEQNEPPESAFRAYMDLYKAFKGAPAGKTPAGGAREAKEDTLARMTEGLERVFFAAAFTHIQYAVWMLLMESSGQQLLPAKDRDRIAARLGHDDEYPFPVLAISLYDGIMTHRDLLNAGLDKLFRQKDELPTAFRALLLTGLYEILIGLASPAAIIDSLSALLTIICSQDESLKGPSEARTGKFLKNQLLKSARAIGRALAFQIIYSLAFTDIRTLSELRNAYALSPYNISGGADTAERGDGVYSWKLVRGVWENAGKLDEIINRYSHKWRLERMGKIEITLLRLALYEMIYEHVPARIVISEIMDIADMYGASEAKNLVNGILDAVAKSGEFMSVSDQFRQEKTTAMEESGK